MATETTIGISLQKAVDLRGHYPETEEYQHFCKAPTAWLYVHNGPLRPDNYREQEQNWQHINVAIAFHGKDESVIKELVANEELYYSPQL